MKIQMLGLSIVLVLSIAGCVAAIEPPSATTKVVILTSPADMSMALIYGWRLGEKSLIDLDGVSFAIQGIQLCPSETKLFYALTGKDITQFIEAYKIKLVEDTGRDIELVKVIPLAKIEGIELGVMNFGPRLAGATEIYLHSTDAINQAQEQKILVARFDGPPAEDRLDAIYSPSRPEGVQLEKHRVVLNPWLPPTEYFNSLQAVQETTSSAPGATAIPIPRPSPWVELSPEAEVYFEISFSIESLEDGQVQYLAIQTLGDGNVLAAVDQNVIVPTPIWVTTPTPTPQPYPQPASLPYP